MSTAVSVVFCVEEVKMPCKINNSSILLVAVYIPLTLCLTNLVGASDELDLPEAVINTSTSTTENDNSPYILSNRVGEKIDRHERDYFGLFPKIDDFVEASCYASESRNVSFVITRGDHESLEDTIIMISAEAVGQLIHLIEHYEDIIAQEHTISYETISGIVLPPPSENLIQRPVVVHLADGMVYEAQILHAQESSLILWRGSGQYNWRLFEEKSISLPYDKLASIVFKKGTRLQTAMSYGARGSLTAGTIGAVIGYAQGDDPPGGCLVMSATDKACMLGGAGVLLGCILGAPVGFLSGAGEAYAIRGDRKAYESVRSLLNENAMFPEIIPPELIKRDGG
jgi:hypothetical protein